MTGGRRRWLLAGVAAIVALVCLGGVALVGSLLSSPTAPVLEKNGPIVPASDVVRLAQVIDQTNSPTPADDQYGNPLEPCLVALHLPDLADEIGIGFSFPVNTYPQPRDFELTWTVAIFNCGDAPVVISPPRKADPASPFHAVHGVSDNAPECPVTSGSLALDPSTYCEISINFPGLPWPPPGGYSDTWTFADNTSGTLHMSGLVPPLATTFYVSYLDSPDPSALCRSGFGGVDTGIDLAAGQEAVLTATGSATWYMNDSTPNGPDGDPAGPAGPFVPSGHIAALIGRVGGGDWMTIGSGPTTVSGPGELQLAFDDAVDLCDDRGAFTVTVQLQAGP